MILTYQDIEDKGLNEPLDSEKEVVKEKRVRKEQYAVLYREDFANESEIEFIVDGKPVIVKLNKGYAKIKASDTNLIDELYKRKFVLVERIKEISERAYVVIHPEMIGIGLHVAKLDGENVEFINGRAIVTDENTANKLKERGYYIALEIK